MTRLLLLFYTIIFFASCGDSTPKGIIAKKEMTSLLTDFHLADGYASMLYGDEKKKDIAAVYKAVYKKYKTDSVQVRKSLEYYTARPQELQLMYLEIDSNLSRSLRLETKLAGERQEIEFQKQDKLYAALRFKEELKADSLDKLAGKYDFKLPDYFRSFKEYLNSYEMPGSLIKADSLRTDSLKIDSLKKDSLKALPKADTMKKNLLKKARLKREKIR